MMMRSFFLIAATLLLGCARYEYDLIQPANLARHVGKTEESFAIEPLEYRLVSIDNSLVMRIFNNSAEPITLEGTRSYAVPPTGQSHPLRPQTIAPGDVHQADPAAAAALLRSLRAGLRHRHRRELGRLSKPLRLRRRL